MESATALLNKSASMMDEPSSTQHIEMLEKQAISSHVDSQQSDTEDASNVRSIELPDMPEVSGSHGNDGRDIEASSPTANVNLDVEAASSTGTTTNECSCTSKFTFGFIVLPRLATIKLWL